MAIAESGICVELREVVLRSKPPEMLKISPKGTVPVLQLQNGTVIDESLDIMEWALKQKNTNNWIDPSLASDIFALIEFNDGEFKYFLDRYKYADRYPEQAPLFYRNKGEIFLAELEKKLNKHAFLCSDQFSLADAAVFPFIRQFANVDVNWFESSEYPAVGKWLNQLLKSTLFLSVMEKYTPWSPGEAVQIFNPKAI